MQFPLQNLVLGNSGRVECFTSLAFSLFLLLDKLLPKIWKMARKLLDSILKYPLFLRLGLELIQKCSSQWFTFSWDLQSVGYQFKIFKQDHFAFQPTPDFQLSANFGSKPAKSDSMIIITKLYPKSHISYLLWGWPLKYVQWKSILNISRFHILEIWFTVHKWLSLKCLMCKAMVFSTWMETLFIIVEGLLELRYISTPEIYTIMGNISLRMKQI